MTLRLIYGGSFERRQIWLLAIGIALTFAAIALLILQVLPAPHTRIHYLIAGSTPTGLGVAAAVAWMERTRLRPRAGMKVRRISRDEER